MTNLTTIISIITKNLNHKRFRKSLAIAVGLLFFMPAITYAADACSGGTITYSGGYTYHTFTANGTLSCSAAATADVLVVGGGGGGGSSNGNGSSGYGSGGGGAAGGVVVANGKALSATNYSVTVGGGGGAGGVGGDSTFDTARAKGGGNGGAYAQYMAGAGGSGGGGSAYYGGGGSAYQPTQAGGANNYGGTGYGNAGGMGAANYGFCNMGGGGGGGAGGAGGQGGQGAGDYWIGGTPGTGLSVWSGYITVGYGGGGGPGYDWGNGTTYTSNYGSGGGGGDNGCLTTAGNAGVQGVVIVRYPTPPTLTNVSLSPLTGTFPAGARTFTTVYRNTNGATDINYVHFLLNYGVDGNNTAFYGLYVRSTNACHIFNSDNAGGWAAQNWSANVNVSGAQSLPHVTLNSCSSSASGNDLTVTWNLTINSWNENLVYQYMYQVSNGGYNTGWTGPHGSSYYVIDTTAPSAPGTMTASWTGDHYVNTSFTANTSAATDNLSGIRGYRLCRSNDNAGGCSAWVGAESASLSTTVSGADLPSNGAYRYYYWYAYDNAGNQSSNSAGEYIRMDSSAPSHDSISVSSNYWKTDNTTTYNITMQSTEAGSGFGGSYGMMALINYQGANSPNYRGYFSWHPSSYVFTDNQVACTGGGYGSKNSGYGAGYITLVSCSTSLNGNQRTVIFTVRPNTNFGDFSNNDISFYTSDALNNQAGWTNFDLNFVSDGTAPTGTINAISTPRNTVLGTISGTASDSYLNSVSIVLRKVSTPGGCTGNSEDWNGSAWTRSCYGLTPTGVANWSYSTTPGAGLMTDGTYYVYLNVADSAGNTSNWSPSQTFVYDATTPTTSGSITGGTLGSNGWYTTNVTYTLSPADATSGVASTVYCMDTSNACTPATPGTGITVSAESATNYVRWRSTDNATNVQTTQSSGAIKIDKTTPTTSGAITGGTLGSNGWYTTNVTYTLTPADATSGVASTVYCVDTTNTCVPGTAGTSITVSTESATNYVRWRSTDNAGIVQVIQSSGAIKIDKGTPTTSGSITGGTAGSNGWYTTNVTYTLVPAAGTSGVAATYYCVDTTNSCTPSIAGTSITVSTESATNYVRWYSVSNSGITQTTQSSGAIKIDKTTPTSPAPTDTGTSSVPTSPLTFSYTASDATSGLSQCYGQVDVNDTDGAALALNTTAIGTSGSYNFMLGVKGATYYFRYYCTDIAGLSASWSSWTNGIYVFADQSPLSISPTSVNYGSSLTLTPSGGSGTGAVTYAVTDAGTAGCSVGAATGVVTYLNIGSCTITATKAGDLTYNSVSSAPTGITVVGIAPNVSSTTLTLVGITRFTIGGTITTTGGYPITARGTCFGSSPSPVTNCVAEGGTATGTMTHLRTGLNPGTLYYVRAYATNNQGTSYSADLATTTQSYPVSSSPTIASVGTSTATFGATLVSNGSTTITARGTCWDYSASPTANCVAEGGTGIGVYSQSRTGLPEGTLVYMRGYASYTDGAGITGTIYSADATTTMIETLKVFDQSGYRFFASSTALVPGTALSTQNTPAMLINGGDVFRMRLLVHLGGTNNLFQNGKQFKLQYALKSGSCDSGFVGETYADVSSTTPISFYDVAALTNNSAIGAQADITHNADTVTNQAYVEQNPFTNSQSSISVGQDGKFDFSLYDNGSFSNTTYCLRAVTYDGLPFASYSAMPEITTAVQSVRVEGFRLRSDNGDASNATFLSSENGSLSVPFIRGDKIRMRFTVSNQGAAQTARRFQLEYSPMTTSCALSSSWTAVPSASNYGGQAFRMEPSPYVPNAAVTSDLNGLTDPQSKTFAPGIMLTNDSITPIITLTPSQFTHLEYSIRSTANIDTSSSYCFRISNNGDASDFVYVAYPQINPISNVFRREAGGGAGVSIVSFETNATTSTTTTGGGYGGGGGGAAGTSTATTTTSTTTPTPGGGGGDVGYLNIGNYIAKTNSTIFGKLRNMARASLQTYPQAHAYLNPEPTAGQVAEQLLVDFFIKIDEIRKSNYTPDRR